METRQSINLLAIQLVKPLDLPLCRFFVEIEDKLDKLCSLTDVIVFPEYCWGDVKYTEVIQGIEKLVTKKKYDNLIIFGTIASETESGEIKNNAIIYENGNINFISKSNILLNEKKRGVTKGHNQRVIDYKGIKFAILICADLWDGALLNRLISKGKAEIVVVPAFTVVPPKHGLYARQLWYSLAITRSREFVVPIVIADHPNGSEIYDVGSVTCVVNPSLKSGSMVSQLDFIQVPKNRDFIVSIIDLGQIKEYRNYRIRNGLLND